MFVEGTLANGSKPRNMAKATLSTLTATASLANGLMTKPVALVLFFVDLGGALYPIPFN